MPRIPRPARTVDGRPPEPLQYMMQDAVRRMRCDGWGLHIVDCRRTGIPPAWQVARMPAVSLSAFGAEVPSANEIVCRHDTYEAKQYAIASVVLVDGADREAPARLAERFGSHLRQHAPAYSMGLTAAWEIRRYPKEQFVTDPGHARRVLRQAYAGTNFMPNARLKRTPLRALKRGAERALNAPAITNKRGSWWEVAFTLCYAAFNDADRIMYVFQQDAPVAEGWAALAYCGWRRGNRRVPDKEDK